VTVRECSRVHEVVRIQYERTCSSELHVDAVHVYVYVCVEERGVVCGIVKNESGVDVSVLE